MSLPRYQAKSLIRQSLAERCFSSETGLCEARGGGVLRTGRPHTLLGNWNTGTMLPLRRESKALPWRDCLAKRTFKSGEGPREARSGGSFPLNLLDNWNTGTLLSPLRPCEWAAETICLAGQRFAKRFSSGRGVATFLNFKNFRQRALSVRLWQPGFTG